MPTRPGSMRSPKTLRKLLRGSCLSLPLSILEPGVSEEDLLGKEEVVKWLEELLASEPYPGKGLLTAVLKQAVCYVPESALKADSSHALLPNISKG